jgi:hypothetical protein
MKTRKTKAWENPRWREKIMQRRRNLIRVLPLPEGSLFISTYYWALVLKQSP